MKPLLMHHDVDPKISIQRAYDDTDQVEVFHNNVLVGIYERPQQLKSGLFLPDGVRAEDMWQGKVGLVLQVGPAAFQDAGNVGFYGLTVKPGDWVVFRPSDGFQLLLAVNREHQPTGRLFCRLLQDIHIMATITHPDLIF